MIPRTYAEALAAKNKPRVKPPVVAAITYDTTLTQVNILLDLSTVQLETLDKAIKHRASSGTSSILDVVSGILSLAMAGETYPQLIEKLN